MMKKILFFLIALTLYACSNNKEQAQQTQETLSCHLEYIPDSTSIGWKAFKTSAKVGVGGTFSDFTIQVKNEGESIVDIFEKASFSIPIDSINSGVADRDQKIISFFFGAMANTSIIEGKVVRLNDSLATVAITLNAVEKEVPLNVSITANEIVLNGTIDMNEWDASAAVASLNEQCDVLHKGEDGSSKLWPDVDIKIRALVQEVCE